MSPFALCSDKEMDFSLRSSNSVTHWTFNIKISDPGYTCYSQMYSDLLMLNDYHLIHSLIHTL